MLTKEGYSFNENVSCLGEAKRILEEKGIKYDRVIVSKIYRNSWTTGLPTSEGGIHQYFMQGDCDIAYYTPTMGWLLINNKPRKWCKEFLENTEIVR
jgi:hypothetical protein